MFAEKSNKLLKTISSKTEIKTKAVTKFCYEFYTRLGISMWSFYNIKTNNKLVNS